VKWSQDFLTLVREAGREDEEYGKAVRLMEREDAVLAGELEQVGREAEEGKSARARDSRQESRKARIKGVLELQQGCVYRKERLWVPEGNGLQQGILKSEHVTKVTGHMGQDKTIELIHRNFRRPKMDEHIIDFFRSCPECQKNKAARHQPYRLLNPLELPYAPWQSIAMDFITDLPSSDGCDQLWVVIDRFTKIAHFIPLPMSGKTASDLARIFACEIWKYYGLATDIVSDHDSRFTSGVWMEVLQMSGIRFQMLTAFHPQTDGQTVRLNQTIEAYLRSFVNHEQDNWVNLLPMAEFAYNNSVTTATAMSPFYANYGFHPTVANPTAARSRNPTSTAYAHGMYPVDEDVVKALEAAQE